jgi:hypothetical protein
LLKPGATRRARDTFMCRYRNANIPRVHTGSWGTTVNQSSRTTLRAPHMSTVIRPIPPAHSVLGTAARFTIEERVALQTDTTSMSSVRPCKAQSRSSTSANENSDCTARKRPGIFAEATSNLAPAKARKDAGSVPSPTLSFRAAVVRIWRIDR